MWIVCYTDERGRNVWDSVADDGDLYEFLRDENLTDEHGELQTDDIMIFREKAQVEDLDHLCYQLRKSWCKFNQ